MLQMDSRSTRNLKDVRNMVEDILSWIDSSKRQVITSRRMLWPATEQYYGIGIRTNEVMLEKRRAIGREINSREENA